MSRSVARTLTNVRACVRFRPIRCLGVRQERLRMRIDLKPRLAGPRLGYQRGERPHISSNGWGAASLPPRASSHWHNGGGMVVSIGTRQGGEGVTVPTHAGKSR